VPRIYLDHNATTPVAAEVLEAMTRVLREGAANASSIHLDGQRAKAHLDEARTAVARVIGSWPDCTADKLTEFAANLLTGEASLVYCAPPGALGELLATFLTTGLTTGVQALPPELVLTRGSQRPAEMLELKQNLVVLRAVGRWSWLVPLGMLLLILALVVRSLPDWGRWWGWPLLAAGLLSLASLLGGGWLWRSALQQVSSQAGGPMLLDLLDGVLAGLTRQISARQLLGSASLLVSGAALLVMARLVARRRAGESGGTVGPAHAGGEDKGPPPTGMFG
jgi:hypothetical protein